MLDYDIVMVTDARLPGGTSASVAEEVRAQARAGYRTALLQVDSPLVRRQRSLAPRIRACIDRGELDLLLDDTPIETRLLMIRHPNVAAAIDPGAVPMIRADVRLLIANQAAGTPQSAAVAAGRVSAEPGAAPGAVTDRVEGDPQRTADEPDAAGTLGAPGAPDAPGAPGSDPADDVPGTGALRYVPSMVSAHLADWLGAEVRWAPIGPLVRGDLEQVAPELVQEPEDWLNVIDVAGWRRPRDGSRHHVPVIGRHSRDDVLKWPADRTALFQAYPGAGEAEVHVLGGARPVEQMLGGELPDNWLVHPFGALAPARFLAGLDIYVYQHHPALVEAFGRSVLEALASGLPTVLGPHFEPLFEDSVVYATIPETREAIARLHRDRDHYRATSARGTAFVEERFGHGVHVDRLRALIGPPRTTGGRAAVAPEREAAPSEADAATSTSATSPADAATPTSAASPSASSGARRVLFVSSNGAGVGHLMRLMSYAKHASDDVEPLFLTFSQGAKVVDDMGLFVEYLASRSISGSRAVSWHPMLKERVGELIERFDIRAMVFDGTWPYQGLLDAAADHPQVQLVWSRRAMWREGVTNPVIEHERDRFDLVIEPGELAADADRGVTTRYRREARRVGPVTYLGLDEMLAPDAARRALELDPERPAALVHLGAGNIDDGASTLGQVIERLGREPDVQVLVTRSIIAERDAQLPDNVRSVSIYPLARYLQAFDLAVVAPGYNSFHELALAAVPTAFVPNLATATDDQGARSAFAERIGIGLDLPEPTAASIDTALSTLLDPERRRRMHERALARRIPGGGPAAMAAIEALLDEGPSGRPTALDLQRAAAARIEGAPAEPSSVAGVRRTPRTVHAMGPDDPVPAAGGALVPAGGPPRTLTPAAKVRRWRKKAQRKAVTMARSEKVLSRVRVPFNALPTPARAAIRRRLRRWERKTRRATGPAFESLPLPLGAPLAARADAPAVDGLPKVGIVIPQIGDTDLVDQLIDKVAQLQMADRTFVPLIITSDLAFKAARRYGYLVEYLPPRDRYERIAADQPWHDANRQRLTDLVGWFGLDQLIVLPDPEPDHGVAKLFGVLAASIATLVVPDEPEFRSRF